MPKRTYQPKKRKRATTHGFRARSATPSGRRVLSYADAADIGGCAVVVSKKAARLAISRHLIKRRLKAILHPWCRKDRVIIVHARSGIVPLPFKELKEELEALLETAFGGK